LNQNIDIFIVKTEKKIYFAHIPFVFTCQLGFQGQRKSIVHEADRIELDGWIIIIFQSRLGR
jgi:hypothetical protein